VFFKKQDSVSLKRNLRVAIIPNGEIKNNRLAANHNLTALKIECRQLSEICQAMFF